NDKQSAYQTLYTCLETVSILSSPIAPFYMDQLYCDLQAVKGNSNTSVHLADFPKVNKVAIDEQLEQQMEIAQRVSSMVLGLRKKERIRVRQPLQKIMVPALDQSFVANIQHVQDLILSEVNIKELEILAEDNSVLVKGIKPNFKTIGPKYGKQMKAIAGLVAKFGQEDITAIEKNNGWSGDLDGTSIELNREDFEISAQEIPGWLVATEGSYTVAMDVTISDELKQEGLARELVNRVQNFRKESGFEITDRINVTIDCQDSLKAAIEKNSDFICNEVLANQIEFGPLDNNALIADIETEGDTKLMLQKV
ncbi:MAG: isoleucyl-tRNA synthetase, partial [Lentimonas sp.]